MSIFSSRRIEERSMALDTIAVWPESSETTVPFTTEHTAQLPALKRILLCTDFSFASQTAAEVASDVCLWSGATMCVLHICEYGRYDAPTELEAAYVEEGLKREALNLTSVVDRIRKQGIEADGVSETGHPPVSIVEFIASHRPDLAVVGTNGYGGLERMIFGSTAEAVFRHASCPVLIVGPRVSFAPQNGHGPVVFATDFHGPAKEAVRYASALAQAKSLPLHCVHVLPLKAERDGANGALPSLMRGALRQVAKEAQISQAEEASYEVLYDSEISHAVVDYARNHHAAFLVLGVRQGQMLSSHLSAHLTYRMIVTASCPVLTISPEAAHRVAGATSMACARG
jgi:nucleotide-binding universal stress UspA family protein